MFWKQQITEYIVSKTELNETPGTRAVHGRCLHHILCSWCGFFSVVHMTMVLPSVPDGVSSSLQLYPPALQNLGQQSCLGACIAICVWRWDAGLCFLPPICSSGEEQSVHNLLWQTDFPQESHKGLGKDFYGFIKHFANDLLYHC